MMREHRHLLWSVAEMPHLNAAGVMVYWETCRCGKRRETVAYPGSVFDREYHTFPLKPSRPSPWDYMEGEMD